MAELVTWKVATLIFHVLFKGTLRSRGTQQWLKYNYVYSVYPGIPCNAPLLLPDCFLCDPMPLTVTLSHPSTSSVTAGRPANAYVPLEKVNELSLQPGCVCLLLSVAVIVMYTPPHSGLCHVSRSAWDWPTRRTSFSDVRWSLSPGRFGILGIVDSGIICQDKTSSESLRLMNYLKKIPWHLLW